MKLPTTLISASTALLLVAVIEAAASSVSPAWKIGAVILFVLNFVILIEKLRN